MALIVAHHFAVHSELLLESAPSFLNVAIAGFCVIGGKLAVNVFVIISGYFLINGRFKPEKVFSLWVQIFLYSSVIYVVFLSASVVQFDWKGLLAAFFPISSNAYWFMTCYLLTYLFSPFINKLIKSISQKQLLLLMLILFVFSSVTPYIFDFRPLSSMSWFIFAYITGAYIALYPKLFEKKWLFVPLFVGSYLLIALLKVFANVSLADMETPSCYICAVSMFVTFKYIKIKHSPVINLLSSATLGVYLIHDNNYIRPFLWKNTLRVADIFATNDFWWKAILIILLVYITCTVIEWARQGFFKALDAFVRYNIFDRGKGRFLR